jgi:uncharacterized membrane protein YgdD (TMEM256/DUF423 family)
MHKQYLVTAAWLAAFTVALGAFGAHGLKAILTPASLATFETGVRYQFYHVFALAITGILWKEYPGKLLLVAGRFFILGILFFSGSLYLLTFLTVLGISDFHWVGAITPLGGLFFILGWFLLGLSILRSGKQ